MYCIPTAIKKILPQVVQLFCMLIDCFVHCTQNRDLVHLAKSSVSNSGSTGSTLIGGGGYARPPCPLSQKNFSVMW